MYKIASLLIPKIAEPAEIIKGLPKDVRILIQDQDLQQLNTPWSRGVYFYVPQKTTGFVKAEYSDDQVLEISICHFGESSDFFLAKSIFKAFQLAGKPAWVKWADLFNGHDLNEDRLRMYAAECNRCSIDELKAELSRLQEKDSLIIWTPLRNVVLGPEHYQQIKEKDYLSCNILVAQWIRKVLYFDDSVYSTIRGSAYRHASFENPENIGILQANEAVFVPNQVNWVMLANTEVHDFEHKDQRFLKVEDLRIDLVENKLATMLDARQFLLSKLTNNAWSELLARTKSKQFDFAQLIEQVGNNQNATKTSDTEIERRADQHELELKKKLENMVGEKIADRYQITGVLGIGGFGAVFKAIHVLMDRPVALKLLHEISYLKMFHKEAVIISSLKHPNILNVYDFGFSDENRFIYLACEFINGTTLTQHIKAKGKIGYQEAVQYVCQICDGLSYAHKKNVIHKDLKPDNIMLAQDENDELRPVILDFGIANVYSPEGPVYSETIAGSTRYMSPEQFNSPTVDARSDIYSLGLIFYEMLCGKPLIKLVRDPLLMLENHLASEAAFDPSLGIPEEIQAAISRALAKNAAERFESAEQFKQALVSAIGTEQKPATNLLPESEPEKESPSFTVMIADDQDYFRDLVGNLLSEHFPEHELVFASNNCNALLDELKKQDADIIFLDIEFPGQDLNGLKAAEIIWRSNPKAKIVIMSNNMGEAYLRRMHKIRPISGAYSWASKDGMIKQFPFLVKRLLIGADWVDPDLNYLFPALAEGSLSNRVPPMHYELLTALALGLDTKAISELMALGPATLQALEHELFSYLGLKESDGLIFNLRGRAIALARLNGILAHEELKLRESDIREALKQKLPNQASLSSNRGIK